jgi:Lrp/AsnC family transcriptional regulator
MTEKIDHLDARIIEALQQDSSLSQRALAERVGMSQNACWRRLQAIYSRGLIKGHTIRLDRDKVGLDVVVFVLVQTRNHSKAWLESFRKHVSACPEVVEFYRIAGEYDYLLKIVAQDIKTYDAVYQRLISKIELHTVTSYFSMEAIEEQRPVPIRPNV